MILELNINLHVIGRDNSQAERDARSAHCREFIREHFVEASYNRIEHNGWDMLVARIDTSNTTMARAQERVAELSTQVEQECIACYFPGYHGRGIGVLVGPKAAQWLGFSIHAFVRYRPDAVVI